MEWPRRRLIVLLFLSSIACFLWIRILLTAPNSYAVPDEFSEVSHEKVMDWETFVTGIAVHHQE